MDLTYAISIMNCAFGKILLQNIFCLSSLILNYQCSITRFENFRNFEHVEPVEILHPNHLHCLILHSLQQIFFLCGKMDFFFTQLNKIKLWAHR